MAHPYQDPGTGKDYGLDVVSDGTVDLSSVVSAVILVSRPDHTEESWPATLANATTGKIRLIVNVGAHTVDHPQSLWGLPGTYKKQALLTFSDGSTLKADAKWLTPLATYEVR